MKRITEPQGNGTERSGTEGQQVEGTANQTATARDIAGRNGGRQRLNFSFFLSFFLFSFFFFFLSFLLSFFPSFFLFPHARSNSRTTGGVELAEMLPSVTWRKALHGAPPEITDVEVARGVRNRALGRIAHNFVASRESESGLLFNLYLASFLNKCDDLKESSADMSESTKNEKE